MKKRLLLLNYLTLILLSAWLAGCDSGARKRIVTFGNATQITSANIAKVYEQLEAQNFEIQVDTLLSEYSRNPAATTVDPSKFEEIIAAEHIQARIDVLTGLSKYADLLIDIMSDDQLNEFDAATKELGKELKTLSESDVGKKYLKGILRDDNDSEILATAVNAIGRYFIEYKRQQTVEQIVKKMNKNISGICVVFTTELEIIHGKLIADMVQRRTARGLYLNHNFDKLSPPVQRQEVRAIVELVLLEKQLNRMIKTVKNSLVALKKTHEKLHQAFSGDKTELDTLLLELVAEAKLVQSFYKSLNE